MTKEQEKNTPTSSSMSERILDVIEKENLTPKPKWHFFLKEWFVWGMVGIALLVGSIATALTIYIGNASRFIEHQIVFSDILFIFKLIPFLWLFLFGIAIFYTVYALRETRRGYKWNPAWLVGSALGLSLILGSSAFASGIGEAIDKYLLTEVPLYKPLTSFQPKMWMDVERGVVAGVVTEMQEEGTFFIEKIDGELLEVSAVLESNLFTQEGLCEGMRVRLVGTTTQDNGRKVFKISEIKPFQGRGGMTHRSSNIPSQQMMYSDVKER